MSEQVPYVVSSRKWSKIPGKERIYWTIMCIRDGYSHGTESGFVEIATGRIGYDGPHKMASWKKEQIEPLVKGLVTPPSPQASSAHRVTMNAVGTMPYEDDEG